MTVKVESTTDTPENVQLAMGDHKPVVEVEPTKEEVAPAASEEKADKTPEESATSEGDDNEESDNEADDKETGDKPKKKGGFQKKIDKLTKRAADAAAEAEYWRNKANAPAEEPKKETVTPPAATGKPDPENFDTHAEYIEALADWKVEERLAERDNKATQAKQRAEAESRNKEWQAKLEIGREKYDDFDEKLAVNVPVSQAMAEVLTTSDVGEELAYYLGSNPAEAIRIANLSPVAAARELGRVEARFAAKPAAVAPKGGAPKPKPVSPVAGGGTSGVQKDPDQMTFQEYKAWRNKQLSNRG